jgi:hypothetical protein
MPGTPPFERFAPSGPRQSPWITAWNYRGASCRRQWIPLERIGLPLENQTSEKTFKGTYQHRSDD